MIQTRPKQAYCITHRHILQRCVIFIHIFINYTKGVCEYDKNSLRLCACIH
nr:MAG TPA: hypothetical protein [Caudoviricetes sp.]